MGNHDPRQPKDTWDKWAIVLSPVGGLFTAVAIAVLTYITSRHLGEFQEKETRGRLYTELMSRREQADTDLRREMFKSIIDNFLKSPSDSGALGDAASLDPEVLKMELLAYNFHDSFDLTPLFKDFERRLEKRIDDGKEVEENQRYLRRLRKVAGDVVTKQLAVLDNSDNSSNTLELYPVDLKAVPGDPSLTKKQAVTVEKIQREITVTVTKIDAKTQEFRISLHVKTLNGPADAALTPDDLLETDAEFWVGSFEFPMIDNIRLSRDQRCAVTVEFYEQESTTIAKITAVCFPGSRATFKEKPYYDEMLDRLQKPGT
jgi:hypothetical protein